MSRSTTAPSEPNLTQRNPDALIDEHRAAAFLSLNHRTLQQWRLRGTGPQFIRISSRCVRYRYRDLFDWVEARVRTSTSGG
jgi:predicted DNA-binding transcriptional regulator AlpA